MLSQACSVSRQCNDVAFTFNINPERALMLMTVAITLLTVASTISIGMLAWFQWPEGSLGYRAVKFFWLDTEYNLPTLYQALVLAMSASLMLVEARASMINREDRNRWRALAALFFFPRLGRISLHPRERGGRYRRAV